VKKTPLEDYVNIRKGGLIAIHLREEDELIGVKLTDGEREIIMGTSKGMSIRFFEQEVRAMGRAATGVKGITLDDDDEVIGMDVVDENSDVLIVTAKGYGKRTPVSEYRRQSRGGKGIKTINVTEKNGRVVGLKIVSEDKDLMVITTSGTLIRTSVAGISEMGRYTQGVRLINIREDDEVSTVAEVDQANGDEQTNANGESDDQA